MEVLNVKEVRKAYFLEAFGRNVENMLIISFGKCNYNCPYCKRDGYFKDSNNTIINAKEISMEKLLLEIDKGIKNNLKIRLSGGDPCCFIKESLYIAKYIYDKYHQKISIAHNGSSIKLVKTLLPYLDYIALDFKGYSNKEIALRSNTKINNNSIFNILNIIKICESDNILVDVRTVIFGDTKLKDLEIIAENIKCFENVFWTLRNYNKVIGCDFEPADIESINAFCKHIKSKYSIKCGYRNKWNNCEFIIL